MYLKQSNRLGLFFLIWFVICVIWYYIQPAQSVLYMQLFKLNFLDFTGMNVQSMILGAIQSYILGYIGVATWMLASILGGLKK